MPASMDRNTDPMQMPRVGEAFVSDIFDEVDEEVRREQLKKLWERYHNYIIAGAVAIVLAVGAWRGYQYWQARLAAEAGAAYDAADQLAAQGKHDEAETAFAKLATDSTAGYRLLAQLREAAEMAERDPKAAVAAYDRIAGETTGQPLVSGLATIRAALLLVDTAPLSEMTQRLDAATQPNSPYRHTARELLALSAWRNHDLTAARRWIDAAKGDPEAPPNLRSRMDMLAALLPEVGRS
jgi:hypothetical protein